ncbi:MAG: hypothetical protein ACI8P3_004161 [Saprospiraceae bacterium]|jgi:hypothetical protein
MLGKERNSELSDEQFLDQAWAKMSGKLDQEMPVIATPSSDSRMRYGVLLLFLFIGFASGLGTMFFLQKDKSIEIEKPVDLKYNPMEVAEVNLGEDDNQITKPIAETDQLAVVNKISKHIEKKIQTNFAKKPANEGGQNNQAIYDQKTYNNSSSVVVFNQNFGMDAEHAGGLNGSPNPQNRPSLIQSENNNNPTEITSTNTVQKKEVAILGDPAYQFEAINALTGQAIPLLKIPWQAVQLDFQLLTSPPKLSFGFYLGTQTRDFEGMHGLSSGIFASYRLDSKFSIRSGLGYSILKGFHLGSHSIADPLTPAFFEPIEVVDLQAYSTVASSESNQDLPIQSLHYIDLPIALDYRMNDKFGILMGMKFSYLLDTKTDGYFSDNLNSEEATLLDIALYDSMKKVDIGTVLGIGIYPTSRVGLELKYNHGLVDYTIDEKWHVRQLNTNKTFELSLNYFLK